MALTLVFILSVFLPLFSVKAEAVDKSNLLDHKSVQIEQNNKAVGEDNPFDPKNNFKVKMSFDFPIMNDALLEFAGITKEEQVDENDFATIKLGKNFK